MVERFVNFNRVLLHNAYVSADVSFFLPPGSTTINEGLLPAQAAEREAYRARHGIKVGSSAEEAAPTEAAVRPGGQPTAGASRPGTTQRRP